MAHSTGEPGGGGEGGELKKRTPSNSPCRGRTRASWETQKISTMNMFYADYFCVRPKSAMEGLRVFREICVKQEKSEIYWTGQALP